MSQFRLACAAGSQFLRNSAGIGSPQRKQGSFRRCRSSALLALRAPNSSGIPRVLGARSASKGRSSGDVAVPPCLRCGSGIGSPQRKQGKEFRRCRSSALLALRAPNSSGSICQHPMVLPRHRLFTGARLGNRTRNEYTFSLRDRFFILTQVIC